jgi:hypothetical protein
LRGLRKIPFPDLTYLTHLTHLTLVAALPRWVHPWLKSLSFGFSLCSHRVSAVLTSPFRFAVFSTSTFSDFFRISDFGFRISLPACLCLSLFCTAPSFAQGTDDKNATFFMGRIRYSSSEGNDCPGVGQDLMKLVSRASTLRIQEERRIKLTDAELYETPFLFMNGHNDFVFTEAELENLRKYLAHGGFFFASGCCTNPDFPRAWRREFGRMFPGEKVKPIPYDHLIYRSFYKIDRVRCLNEPRDIQLEGLFYQGNLVAVVCEDGLCCAFSANNTCNTGRGISPDEGQKLTLNIAVYALTH